MDQIGRVEPSILYIFQKWLISHCCRVQAAHACINVFGTIDNKITSIIDDSRYGMSDVAFRTTPPICGLSYRTLHVTASDMLEKLLPVSTISEETMQEGKK